MHLPGNKKSITMSSMYRERLRVHFGASFLRIASRLEREGIVILPGYLSADVVERLRRVFARIVLDKDHRPFEALISVSGPVDAPRLTAEPELTGLFNDPLPLALSADHLQSATRLANWRAYRQLRRSPLRYRAWDWHTDQRLDEVKVMVLLTTVSPQGQPMQYAPRSHLAKLAADYQSGTKFSLEEALSLGDGRIVQATGVPGTVIVFNPNGLHRGTRSLTEERDVITYTFVRDIPGHPTFLPSDSGSANWTHSRELVPFGRGKLPQPVRQSISALSKNFSEVGLCPFEVADIAEARRAYVRTPTYEDVKPRHTGEKSVISFVADHPDIDFPADLNLPLHEGDADVRRDIQLVTLRDRARDDSGWQSFTELLLTVPPDTANCIEFPMPSVLESVFSTIHSLCLAVRSRLSSPITEAADRIIAFLGDLASTDLLHSAQLMRSTLAYTAATLVDLEREVVTSGTSTAVQKEYELAGETLQLARYVARLYVQAVAADESGVRDGLR